MAEIILILGGSGSGKSEFAEGLISVEKKNKYYIATMKVFGEEGLMKVEKHRNLRNGKGFLTLECEKDIYNLEMEKESVILLECIGNLCANWLFDSGLSFAESFLEIKRGIEHLAHRSEKLIIVSNDIFCDGIEYEKDTLEYIRLVGKVNNWLGEIAKQVIEVVYSIPVYHKGDEKENV